MDQKRNPRKEIFLPPSEFRAGQILPSHVRRRLLLGFGPKAARTASFDFAPLIQAFPVAAEPAYTNLEGSKSLHLLTSPGCPHFRIGGLLCLSKCCWANPSSVLSKRIRSTRQPLFRPLAPIPGCRPRPLSCVCTQTHSHSVWCSRCLAWPLAPCSGCSLRRNPIRSLIHALAPSTDNPSKPGSRYVSDDHRGIHVRAYSIATPTHPLANISNAPPAPRQIPP